MNKYSHKLLAILRAMPKKSRRQAGLFLASSPQKAQTLDIQLFEYLIHKINRPFDKVNAYNTIFPNKAYDDIALRRIMSSLTKKLEEFLTLEHFSSQKIELKFHYLQALETYGLDKQYRQEWNNLKKMIEKNKGAMFDGRFRLYKSIFFHPATNKHTEGRVYYQKMMEFLELNSAYQALKYRGESLLFNRLADLKEGETILPILTNQVSDRWNEKYPSIAFFSEVVNLLATSSKTDFRSLQQKLEALLPVMNEEDVALCVKLLLNYAGTFATRGDQNYQKILFEFVKWTLDRKLLLENGRLSETRFLNIVVIAAKQKAFDWIKLFMIDYKMVVISEDIEKLLAVGEAYSYYHEGLTLSDLSLLQLALNRLETKKRSKTSLALRVHSLQIRITFELLILSQDSKYYESLLVAAKKFRAFFSYDKERFKGGKANSYKMLVNLVLAFAKWITSPDRLSKPIEDWQYQLETDELIMKDWLLHKLEEMNLMIKS